MPELTDGEMQKLLEEISKNAIPVTLHISAEDESQALIECDEYIKTGNKNINDMSPLSIYYIISKLPSHRQIKFIKENIKYIKEHDEEIFLYNMLSPKSLSYFFTYDVLKELRNIDKDIFKKIINGSFENLFYGFTHDDYCRLYTECYDELIKIDNRDFISILYCHNRCCYFGNNYKDVNKAYELQRKYNKECMELLLTKYKDKISIFPPRELLKFIVCIEDIDVYSKFITNNYEKINNAFCDISEYELKDYLGEINEPKQEILISNFFENIVKNKNIKEIIYKISPNIIIELYNKNKTVFNELTLNDWIKICSRINVFNDEFRNILDTFKIDNIEELFDTNFYNSYWKRHSLEALEYIETKYRSNIKTTGVIENIDKDTSIFSEKYIKNLSEIRVMFQNNSISKNDNIYKQHLSNFILFLQNQNIINSIEDNNFKEIEKLFYRIIMGKSMTVLYQVSSIEEIAIINRLGQIDFHVKNLTVEQIRNYNVKQHKQLYKKYETNKYHIKSYKILLLKLIFMFGFNNTKALLEIDDSLPVLEHFAGTVDVKNIKLDEQGNPILNNKLINLLFNDKDLNKIKEMLTNKDNELYKYFPRIFSEWEIIKINGKDKSLSEIIEFLKCDDISLPVKYYRLEGLFKFIGCRNSIVNETLSLHDQMLNRVSATIPRIVGTKEDYTYEILKLDDMESIAVGNKTDCCFTVLGNGYSCLKHALTSKNGRIFAIKKDGEILAHSWIWRNGDLLCFDNIEISKKINCVDFFDVYLQAADELINASYQSEGIESCVKNVTIGFTNFDKEIKGIEKYPCLIAKNCDLENKDFGSRLGNNRKFVDVLPQPIEEVGYSDSKNVQYLIRGNGIFNLGQSHFNYQDDRKEVMHYSKEDSCNKDYIELINKKINALRYVKQEIENTLSSYIAIDIKDLKEVYCNDDWYVISYLDGTVERFNNSSDERSVQEINKLPLYKSKIKIQKK